MGGRGTAFATVFKRSSTSEVESFVVLLRSDADRQITLLRVVNLAAIQQNKAVLINWKHITIDLQYNKMKTLEQKLFLRET